MAYICIYPNQYLLGGDDRQFGDYLIQVCFGDEDRSDELLIVNMAIK
jgi:hypothetical protein